MDEGADANTAYRLDKPMTLNSLLADLWNRLKRNKPAKERAYHPCALLLPYYIATDKLQPIDNPTLVRALLEHGANPNSKGEDGESLLEQACAYDNIETVRLLLAYPVNPNEQDNFGLTPLMLTHYACARLLIDKGAKVSISNHGFNALDYAESQGDKDLLRLLQETLKKERTQKDSQK